MLKSEVTKSVDSHNRLSLNIGSATCYIVMDKSLNLPNPNSLISKVEKMPPISYNYGVD